MTSRALGRALRSGRARGAAATRSRGELVLHLSARELAATHRRTALGWTWPLLLQLVQLGVLIFVFRRVIPLGVPDYPTFVFTGLAFWSWLSSGVLGATSAITDNAPLVLEPRMPRAVLPLVALAVTGFDLLVALPVLLALVALTVGLGWTALLLPVLILVQAVLMAGLALALSAMQVHLRDTRPLVAVVLLLAFYLTPVFYPLDAVPERYRELLRINPATTLIDAYHDVLVYGRVPPALPLILLALGSAALLAIGVAVFRRLEGGFVDEL